MQRLAAEASPEPVGALISLLLGPRVQTRQCREGAEDLPLRNQRRPCAFRNNLCPGWSRLRANFSRRKILHCLRRRSSFGHDPETQRLTSGGATTPW